MGVDEERIRLILEILGAKDGKDLDAVLKQIKSSVDATSAPVKKATKETYDFADAYELLETDVSAATSTMQRAPAPVDAFASSMKNATTAANASGAAVSAAGDKIEKAGTKAKEAGSKVANSGQALLQSGRVIQDFVQGGIGGILNNVEGLAMALGGGAGLAGTLTAVGVAAFVATPFIKSWLASLTGPELRQFTTEVETLRLKIKEAEDNPVRIAINIAEIERAKQRMDELIRAQQIHLALSNRQNVFEGKSGRAVQDIVADSQDEGFRAARKAAIARAKEAGEAGSEEVQTAVKAQTALENQLAKTRAKLAASVVPQEQRLLSQSITNLEADLVAAKKATASAMKAARDHAVTEFGLLEKDAIEGIGQSQATAQEKLARIFERQGAEGRRAAALIRANSAQATKAAGDEAEALESERAERDIRNAEWKRQASAGLAKAKEAEAKHKAEATRIAAELFPNLSRAALAGERIDMPRLLKELERIGVTPETFHREGKFDPVTFQSFVRQINATLVNLQENRVRTRMGLFPAETQQQAMEALLAEDKAKEADRAAAATQEEKKRPGETEAQFQARKKQKADEKAAATKAKTEKEALDKRTDAMLNKLRIGGGAQGPEIQGGAFEALEMVRQSGFAPGSRNREAMNAQADELIRNTVQEALANNPDITDQERQNAIERAPALFRRQFGEMLQERQKIRARRNGQAAGMPGGFPSIPLSADMRGNNAGADVNDGGAEAAAKIARNESAMAQLLGQQTRRAEAIARELDIVYDMLRGIPVSNQLRGRM